MIPRLLLILIAVLVLRLQLAVAIHDLGMYQLDQQKLAHRGLGCLWLAAEMQPESQRFQIDYLEQWLIQYQDGRICEWQKRPTMPFRSAQQAALFNEPQFESIHRHIMMLHETGSFYEMRNTKFKK